MTQQTSAVDVIRPWPAPRAFVRNDLPSRLFATRRQSVELAQTLTPEDMTVQANEDASPTKWHLAHVTWFFETFILQKYLDGYAVFDETFNFCFNSYYEALGPRQPRVARGLLTRPSADHVLAYRIHVDEALARLLADGSTIPNDVARLVELGINHEQQHQELLLTDILALFAANPLQPAYRTPGAQPPLTQTPEPAGWIDYAGGIRCVGHDSESFAWDNEAPCHEALIRPFRLADRLVTNAEWLEFMAAGGYESAAHWLADGWTTVNREQWASPLYWERHDGNWFAMTLEGFQPIELSAPVCHVSYFEADAFARWTGRRLPTEFEWEVAASKLSPGPITHAVRPRTAEPMRDGRPRQMFGEVWQWTQSAYAPYPGYKPPTGAIGEYNGKFMVSQQVLRGSSCITPDGHARATYRNFFYPHQRWQFVGVRLASEIE